MSRCDSTDEYDVSGCSQDRSHTNYIFIHMSQSLKKIGVQEPSVCAVAAQGSCRNSVFEYRAAVEACPWRAKPIAVIEIPRAFEGRVRDPKSSVLVVSVKTKYRQMRLPRKARNRSRRAEQYQIGRTNRLWKCDVFWQRFDVFKSKSGKPVWAPAKERLGPHDVCRF